MPVLFLLPGSSSWVFDTHSRVLKRPENRVFTSLDLVLFYQANFVVFVVPDNVTFCDLHSPATTLAFF